MNKSEQINELAKALSSAQGDMKGAAKDAVNPGYVRGGKPSSYATLASVWDACRHALAANGLSVAQTMDCHDSGVVVETTLLHSSGQWLSGRQVIKPVEDKPQSWGSAITYARRYGLAAIAGVAPEDDDGNDASGVHVDPKAAQQEVARQKIEGFKAAGFGEKSDALKAEMEAKKAEANPEVNPFSGEKYVELPISDKQSKRLYAIAKSKNWTDEEIKKALMDGWGIGHTKEIKGKKIYETICAFFEGGKKESGTDVDPFALAGDDESGSDDPGSPRY